MSLDGRDERVADLFFIDQTDEGDPSEDGLVRYGSSDLRICVGSTVYSLISGSGLTEATHEPLDTLVHEIAENAYEEIVKISGQVSSDTIWETAAKLKKIRETLVTRVGGQVSVVVVKQYDSAGALKKTLTGTITRVSGQVDNIAWVKT
jgi:hypothetical protein